MGGAAHDETTAQPNQIIQENQTMTAPFNDSSQGGGLDPDDPTRVVRATDEELYQELQAGSLCYVFNSRQMGKTTLQNSTIPRLQQAGFACVPIYLGATGSLTEEQWYTKIARELVEALQLGDRQEFVKTWWKERSSLAPVQRLEEFLETVLLVRVQQPVVIFFDEIDIVRSLRFSPDDFFALLRSCHQQRALKPDYRRLTFVLLGVATPSDLMSDKRRSPFNIGQAIHLEGFKLYEVAPLEQRLVGKVGNPHQVLGEILTWTGGQPFLTQKLRHWVETGEFIPEGQEAEVVESLVRSRIIDNWESNDEPEHLRTIRDRVLSDEQRKGRLLGLYQEILDAGGAIEADNSEEQTELCLSGLVVREQGNLRVYNRIYAEVFDLAWVKDELLSIRPYAEELDAWLASDEQDESCLLQGEALKEVEIWAKDKRLSVQDERFIRASQVLERQQEQQKTEVAKQEAQEAGDRLVKANEKLVKTQRRIKLVGWGGAAVLASIFALAGIEQVKLQNALVRLKETRTGIELERQGAEALKQFEVDQLGALLKAMRAGRKLQQMVKDGRPLKDYPATSPMLALQTILSNIRESNRFEDVFSRFSPNGKLMAITVNDTVQLWNWTKKIGEFKVGFVKDIRFSPDSKLIAVADTNGEIQLWNIAGEQIAKINGYKDISDKNSLHGEQITLYFSPDSKLIAALREVRLELFKSEEERIVRLWNWSGQKLTEIKEKGIQSIAISPSGRQIATFGSAAQLWNSSGKQFAELKANAEIGGVSVSPDSKLIATVDKYEENTVRLWNWSGQQLTQFSLAQSEPNLIKSMKSAFFTVLSTYNVQFAPNSKLLATFGKGLLVWDVSDPENISPKSWTWIADNISDVAIFSPDSKSIVTIEDDGTVQVLKLLRNANLLERFKTGESINSAYAYATFNADGKQIAIVQPRSVKFWKLFQHNRHTGFRLAEEDKNRSIEQRFSRSGNQIIALSEKGAVRLWDLAGKRLPVSEKFKAHHITKEDKIIAEGVDGTIQLRSLSGQLLAKAKGSLDTVRFSPDGKQIAIRKEHSVQLLNSSGQQLELSVKPDLWSDFGNNSLTSIFKNGANFSPDGQAIAIPADDGVYRWSISGQKLPELKHKLVDQVLFSPTGKQIVTVSNIGDTSFFIWDSSGRRLAQLNTEDARGKDIKVVKFSPDGEQVATLSEDGNIRLWSISGQLIATLRGHKDRIDQIEYSPDSQRIATTTGNQVRLWNRSGQLIAEFQPRPGDGGLTDIRFSPDGKQIVTLWNGPVDYHLSSIGVRILPVEDLSQLLDRGCAWLQDYLHSSPNARESDRRMCGIKSRE